MAGATGRVSLPRLVFKADVGSYRLLLGNPEATAPRYDLLSLRQEVLAYSARSVEASPLEPNPAFRRSAADYFRATPPTALLWGALVVAVAALLFLTARVLRSERQPGAEAQLLRPAQHLGRHGHVVEGEAEVHGHACARAGDWRPGLRPVTSSPRSA